MATATRPTIVMNSNPRAYDLSPEQLKAARTRIDRDAAANGFDVEWLWSQPTGSAMLEPWRNQPHFYDALALVVRNIKS